MLNGPLLPTLLRLATPNVIGLFAMTIIIGYDGYILGRLGADALAGIALVFPLSMLMIQMSAGGIGGAVTAAVARALGAGRSDEAGRLAQQSLLIATALAAVFALGLLGYGRPVYALMGGRGAALEAALAYSNVMFGGAMVIWFTNVLGAVVRGTGNMLLPAAMLVATALIHVVLCPTLVFGWGPIPGLGAAGAAVSLLIANGTAALVLAWQLMRRGAAAPLNRTRWQLHAPLLRDILRVGVPASMSPVISNASIAVATAYVGSFGTAALAGYGVAARLEYILVPIAFGFGTALTAMVATNMGAGQSQRALNVAWLGAGMVAAITGTINATANPTPVAANPTPTPAANVNPASQPAATAASSNPITYGSATTGSTASSVGDAVAPAAWYPDPSGRYELRYWNGSAWTEHVSRNGQQFTDPPVA